MSLSALMNTMSPNYYPIYYPSMVAQLPDNDLPGLPHNQQRSIAMRSGKDSTVWLEKFRDRSYQKKYKRQEGFKNYPKLPIGNVVSYKNEKFSNYIPIQGALLDWHVEDHPQKRIRRKVNASLPNDMAAYNVRTDRLKLGVYVPVIGILVMLGIFGNSCIIAVCCMQKTLSSGYTYIGFLALSDLLACLCMIPWPVVHLIAVNQGWRFGLSYGWNFFLIRVTLFLVNTFMKFSALLTCALSLDRYVALHYPHKYAALTKRRRRPRLYTRLIVAFCFFLAFGLMVPRVRKFDVVRTNCSNFNPESPMYAKAVQRSYDDLNHPQQHRSAVYNRMVMRYRGVGKTKPADVGGPKPSLPQASSPLSPSYNKWAAQPKAFVKQRGVRFIPPPKESNQEKNVTTTKQRPKCYNFRVNKEYHSSRVYVIYKWWREIVLTLIPLIMLSFLNACIINKYKKDIMRRKYSRILVSQGTTAPGSTMLNNDSDTDNNQPPATELNILRKQTLKLRRKTIALLMLKRSPGDLRNKSPPKRDHNVISKRKNSISAAMSRVNNNTARAGLFDRNQLLRRDSAVILTGTNRPGKRRAKSYSIASFTPLRYGGSSPSKHDSNIPPATGAAQESSCQNRKTLTVLPARRRSSSGGILKSGSRMFLNIKQPQTHQQVASTINEEESCMVDVTEASTTHHGDIDDSPQEELISIEKGTGTPALQETSITGILDSPKSSQNNILHGYLATTPLLFGMRTSKKGSKTPSPTPQPTVTITTKPTPLVNSRGRVCLVHEWADDKSEVEKLMKVDNHNADWSTANNHTEQSIKCRADSFITRPSSVQRVITRQKSDESTFTAVAPIPKISKTAAQYAKLAKEQQQNYQSTRDMNRKRSSNISVASLGQIKSYINRIIRPSLALSVASSSNNNNNTRANTIAPNRFSLAFSEDTIERHRRYLRDERNLTLMLIITVLQHLICTGPQAIITIFDTADKRRISFGLEVTFLVTNCLEAVNYVLNFYIYCLFVKDFRMLFLKMLQAVRKTVCKRFKRN